jgi:hypothetical protein
MAPCFNRLLPVNNECPSAHSFFCACSCVIVTVCNMHEDASIYLYMHLVCMRVHA